jgi:hypothetical protein
VCLEIAFSVTVSRLSCVFGIAFSILAYIEGLKLTLCFVFRLQSHRQVPRQRR